MRQISMQEAADFLDDAVCTEPPIDAGHDRVVIYGIDAGGLEFMLVTKSWAETAELGYLH